MLGPLPSASSPKVISPGSRSLKAQGFRGSGFTGTPTVCKIMAFMAVIMGLGLFFAYLWGLGRGKGLRCGGSELRFEV